MKIEEVAFNKGYKVNEKGEVISPKGVNRKLQKRGRDGKLTFGIKVDDKDLHCNVHRLVAFQKYGSEIYKDDVEVRHKNGNRFDNTPENVFLSNSKERRLSIPKEKRVEYATYASSFVKKYDKTEVKQFYENCKSYKQTMEHFGISSKGTLNFILKH